MRPTLLSISVLFILILIACSQSNTKENSQEVTFSNDQNSPMFDADSQYKEENVKVLTEDMLEEWHIEALNLLRDYQYTDALILLNKHDDEISNDIELITRSKQEVESENPVVEVIKSHLSKIKYSYDITTVNYFLNNINNKLNKITSSNAGVIVGMTKEQVLKSNWGEPSNKNVTKSTLGTSEQWVYGNGNYLYFTDDILTAISTSD
ncbi:hypothetical protein [Sediminibacillus halophilus]|uniref:Uncharacterized protein n=1 Tax=Sediminibacillus halophilus TaxID=482461 RepID=A0A1G9QTX9_9BACI|nr:hypothetical protein [Sediminibacillus halophilus]SDM14341.1 hypothetical protein SAMN05216244_1658 [Sediminibacillus halophilus]